MGKIKLRKAAGPDGIAGEMITLAGENSDEVLLDIYTIKTRETAGERPP